MKQRILVDTDILVDFFHNQKYAKELITEFQAQGPVCISILSITELRTGFTSKQAKFFLPKLYDIVAIINLNVKIAELAGEFRFDYGSKGKSLSTIDTLIAATAIVNDFQLVTRNKKDFPMKNLKLYPLQ